mmetsp:Transcript_12618/g.26968  ORF Transcript_12618/g.26968 Transcript_12618/m.26968 type:complete len:103 (-) Transcript_12618:594-902(-)
MRLLLSSMMRKLTSTSHTPAGNFSSKRGNKNFYKGKGGKKYGKLDNFGRFWQTKKPMFYMPRGMDTFTLKPYVGWGHGLPSKQAQKYIEGNNSGAPSSPPSA